ncbi:MAG: transposase, partial [Deltaproteobacteria bacterium CG_4_8_14_3_um_filter_43_13]
YDHIIRNESELERIREYIVNNPLKWESDRENPNIRVRRAMPQQDEPWRI